MVFRDPFGVTRDRGNYGLCTTVRLELRLDKALWCFLTRRVSVHGDVDAVGFATGSAAGLANGRDGGIPTKRNSAVASNEARKAKMSEHALKSFRDRAPSKLKVPGSNPAGVANEIKPLAPISVPEKLQMDGWTIATFVPEMTSPPAGERLMTTADAGGSNGYRVRLWKIELEKLANELKLAITVCHLPPVTSKWNKIEHRLFSFITMNWRGKRLRSFRTIVQLIAATMTDAGLKIRAELDENKYPKGVKISDAQLAAANLRRHSFDGDWNYTISPIADKKLSRNRLLYLWIAPTL
jgi:hypothetical protein